MYTVEQIRKAGAEGEISSIDTEHLIKVLNELYGSNVSQNNGNAIVSGSLPPLDWTILRQKYFSDCTVKDSVDGLKLRIDYAPHDLFEWFKREIQLGGNDR